MLIKILMFFLFLLMPVACPAADLFVHWESDWPGETAVYATIQSAVADAAPGDIIRVSGGTGGHVYEDGDLYIDKAIAIVGSTIPGHNGPVTLASRIQSACASGTAIVRNLHHRGDTGAYRSLITLYAGSDILFEDCEISGYRSANVYTIYPYQDGGAVVYRRCLFQDNYQTSWNDCRLFYDYKETQLSFEWCIFGPGCGFINMQRPGSSLSIANCVAIAPKARVDSINQQFLKIGPDAGPAIIRNSAFIASAVDSSADNIIAENVFWHSTYSYSSFDDAGLISVIDEVADVNPLFENIQALRFPDGSPVGSFLLRIDDTHNTVDAVASAAVMNPAGLKVSLAVSVGPHYGLGGGLGSESETVHAWRDLVENGNEIICHGGAHGDATDLRALTVFATGSNPTIAVSVVQNGDSSTWSGALFVSVDGVVQRFDLADPAYDTLGELINALDGLSIGNGVVTASKTVSTQSIYSPSMMLKSVADFSISEARELSFDEAAYVRVEAVEAIADLQAYIRTGADRNGNHDTGAGAAAAGSLAASYKVTSWAAPNGRGRPALQEALAGLNETPVGGQVVGPIAAAMSAGGPESGFWNGTTFPGRGAFNRYNLRYWQVGLSYGDGTKIHFAMLAAAAGWVAQPLWHGETAYDGSLEKLRDLLVGLGIGNRTFSESVEVLLENGAWTASGASVAFSGFMSDFTEYSGLVPQENSPLRDAGANEAWSGTPDVSDFSGISVTDENGVVVAPGFTVEIGACEYAPENPDSDGDGLPDAIEQLSCTGEYDVDSDDDGISDGDEDVNKNGVVDAGETDPCNADSDGDGIQDGTESGVSVPTLDTNILVFIADADPETTTDPINPDSDGDGFEDGEEDLNCNGRVDLPESDPNNENSYPVKVDLEMFSGQFGEASCPSCIADMDGDGDVDGRDLYLFIAP